MEKNKIIRKSHKIIKRVWKYREYSNIHCILKDFLLYVFIPVFITSFLLTFPCALQFIEDTSYLEALLEIWGAFLIIIGIVTCIFILGFLWSFVFLLINQKKILESKRKERMKETSKWNEDSNKINWDNSALLINILRSLDDED